MAISRKGNLIKAMIRCFCLSAKAMRLWRDVRLWHVADYVCHCERSVAVICLRRDIRMVSFNRLNKKRTRGFGYVFYVLSLLFENRLQGDYGVAVAAVRSKSQILFGKGDIFVHAETVEVAHAYVVLRDRQVLLCRLHII